MKSLVVVIAVVIAYLFMGDHKSYAQSTPWVSAYYAGWSQGWSNNGLLPAEAIDYSAITHIMHFSLVPRSDGSLDADANSMTTINSAAIISSAHAAGKKGLITVGG